MLGHRKTFLNPSGVEPSLALLAHINISTTMTAQLFEFELIITTLAC
jgi:hypothetical protein